jgi:site-specific DNA-methyltransferase (adenine-specific)
MKIIKRNISELSQDPANARKHNDRNIESIVASLRRFGQQTPIVIDSSNVVRKGNGTIEAAKRLGWDTINCVVTDLKSSDAISYAIADNRTAELAEWDDEVLSAQLNGLLADDPELLEVAGFTEEELAELLADSEMQPEIIEDEVPEPPAEPITRSGDLWILGEHRLLCGDSTKADDVERLMAGAKAELLNTDPPYGVSVAGGTHDPRDTKNYRSGGKIQNDGLTGEKLAEFLEAAFSNAQAYLSAGAAWYVWYADTETAAFLKATCALGGMRHILVWVKPNFVFGRCDYHYRHEPVMYGWTPGAGHRWYGDRTQDSVWEAKVGLDLEKKLHPTSKPVSIASRPIQNHTKQGDVVADMFLGSGTTLIAAEQLGRKCYGMEISSQYVDVICNRWAKLTNESPVLDETGETFDQVAKRRRGNE